MASFPPPEMISPTPSTWKVGKANVNGVTYTVIIVDTPVGQHVYMLPPEQAGPIGEQITAVSKSGPQLVIPSQQLLMPNGSPHV